MIYMSTPLSSPQKTCHNIAKLLNSTERSPFLNRIKILGVASGKPAETLTQATFVDRLIKFISRDPMKDRDDLKRGRKPRPTDGADKARLIFRDLFVAERDAEIAKIIWNYFDAVRKRWPHAVFPSRVLHLQLKRVAMLVGERFRNLFMTIQAFKSWRACPEHVAGVALCRST